MSFLSLGLARNSSDTIPTGKKHHRTITIINHIDGLNLGDASLLIMTISLIKKAIRPSEIHVLSLNPDNDTKLIELIDDFNVKFLLSPGRISVNNKARNWLDMLLFLFRVLVMRLSTNRFGRGNPAIDSLQMAEFVVVRGGDNLGDTYGLGSLVTQIYNILLAIILRKRILVLGTSIGPFKSKIVRKLACFFLKKVDAIIVRDRKSLDILTEEQMDEKKLHLIPDVVFDLPIIQDLKYQDLFNNGHSAYVGIGISAISQNYIQKDLVIDILTNLCECLKNTHNVKIILIPHVLSHFSDRDFADELLSKMRTKESIVIIHEENPMKIKYVISHLDLLISFRMHPLVHALSLGIPVIGIDYNDKTKELFKLCHLEHWVVPIENIITLPSIVDKFFAMKENENLPISFKQAKVTEQYVNVLESFARRDHTYN